MLTRKLTDKQALQWSHMREIGMARWVFLTGMMAWGSTACVVMNIWISFVNGGMITPTSLFKMAIIWWIGGFVFGITTWFFAEKSYRKYKASQELGA
jgi:hypothetical protein